MSCTEWDFKEWDAVEDVFETTAPMVASKYYGVSKSEQLICHVKLFCADFI